jgi:hypothetical protein
VFSVPTVFVIGAGAGKDIDMPVGSVLSDTIAKKLDIFFEQGQLQRGDGLIVEVLRRIARERNANVNDWIMAGRSVAKGIRFARSIDSYINTHRDDEKIRECAKLAIVRSIIESERDSAIFIDNGGNWKNESKVDASWLPIMMYLLQEKIVKSHNLNDLFANFTIINFNYDRCIEHFLFNAVQQLYRLDQKEAAGLFNRWKRIYHPYGSVGVLPWQQGNRKVAFGAADYGDIWGLSQEIFTYNEQMSAGDSLGEIRTAITNARRIVFLGFHFHQQNMDLLQTTVAGGAVDVYATAVDRDGPEVDIIHSQIRNCLTTQRQANIVINNTRKCTGLLNEYGTTLAR